MSWELDNVSQCHKNIVEFTVAGAGPIAKFFLLGEDEMVGAI